jgi:hypothetical protein
MTEKHPGWTRQGSAFWRAHHEAWKRSNLNVRGIDAGLAMATNSGFSKRQHNLVRVLRRWPAGTASLSAFYADGSKGWRQRQPSSR